MPGARPILIARDASAEDAQARATRVVRELQSLGILGELRLKKTAGGGSPFEPRSVVLADKQIWPPGPNALEAIDMRIVEVRPNSLIFEVNGERREGPDFRKLDDTYLEVFNGWQLFCTDDVQFRCPACGAEMDSDEILAAVEELDAELACGECEESATLRAICIEPPGAYAALAFDFRGWPRLRAHVLELIAGASQSEVAYVWHE